MIPISWSWYFPLSSMQLQDHMLHKSNVPRKVLCLLIFLRSILHSMLEMYEWSGVTYIVLEECVATETHMRCIEFWTLHYKRQPLSRTLHPSPAASGAGCVVYRTRVALVCLSCLYASQTSIYWDMECASQIPTCNCDVVQFVVAIVQQCYLSECSKCEW